MKVGRLIKIFQEDNGKCIVGYHLTTHNFVHARDGHLVHGGGGYQLPAGSQLLDEINKLGSDVAVFGGKDMFDADFFEFIICV